MVERIRRSFALARTSYALLRAHPRLAVLPVLSSLAGLLVMASFLLPLWTSGHLETLELQGQDPAQDPLLLGGTFLFYFVSYFVVVFFNAALVACTVQALDGRSPRLSDGFGTARERLPQILGWALLGAVVGTLLALLERNRRFGGIVSALLGTAWTALTFFAVPVLVLEGLGPLEAVRRSGRLLRETWGEALVGDLSVGWIGFLIALPALAAAALLLLAAPQIGSGTLLVAGTVAGLGLLASAVVSSAADVIFKVLLYRRAAGGSLPGDVDVESLVGRLPEPIA